MEKISTEVLTLSKETKIRKSNLVETFQNY